MSGLEEFRALGVDFVSYTENVDTSTPMGKVVFTMIPAFSLSVRAKREGRKRANPLRPSLCASPSNGDTLF